MEAAGDGWFARTPSPALTAVAQKGCTDGSAPAMACGVLRCDGAQAVFEMGCAGQRQLGGAGGECELGDRWHLGSNTKALTATLAALCIEAQDSIAGGAELSWGTTVDEALPELAIHAGYSGVTLAQLLDNCSGAPGAAPADCWALAWEQEQAGAAPAQQRLRFVKALLALPPETERGTFSYSNQGFAIAGHMLETVADVGYEELITTRLLTPLGITTGGFGPALGDSPWGHASEGTEGTTLSAKDPTVLGSDNPTAIAPAGRLHMSLPDWGRFVAAVVSPEVASAKLGLPHEAWAALHAPAVATDADRNMQYGGGWLVVDRPWADGLAISHSGSNTMNYCTVWAVPAGGDGRGPLSSMAVLVASNAGSDGARAAVSAQPAQSQLDFHGFI